ncbi:right-handed parallel beta-helix repeat-containing protein [Geofilum sp. OHC36d9]|uniref:right-handed parallel beta-helix repeat-containing protein n=1 Tax=Geofilum sp. OHC36d9 TaxID=3458413 RepID=UPI00403462B1
MKNQLKFLSFLLAVGVVFSFTACDEDNNNTDDPGQASGNLVVTENITENTTWTKDHVYELGGRITVVDQATLTIEPGTVIKGQSGTGANATALLVARGGKLMAEGTAAAPIIFTAVNDEITPEDVAAGDFGSPNLDPDVNGLWGGVIILGKSRISASNEDNTADASELQVEGIPTSDPNGLYGGSVLDDNSGVLRYVSIRHGGTNIGSGNEINGLTLGGVGSGTTIDHIEIVSNQDDGVEWFGGTVNVTNLLVWNVGDDGIDADMSYTGTISNFLVLSPAGHNFELDGPEGTADYGAFTIKNGVVVASDDDYERVSEDLINTDDNTSVTFENVFITGIKEGQQINRVIFEAGVTSFTGVVLDVDAAALADYVNGDVPTGVTAASAPAKASDIDLSVFNGWTWASEAGKIPAL